MTCKFVLKGIIREKLLVDNNELIKTVAETFSTKIFFFFFLNILYISIYYLLLKSLFNVGQNIASYTNKYQPQKI